MGASSPVFGRYLLGVVAFCLCGVGFGVGVGSSFFSHWAVKVWSSVTVYLSPGSYVEPFQYRKVYPSRVGAPGSLMVSPAFASMVSLPVLPSSVPPPRSNLSVAFSMGAGGMGVAS
jgi:hypothetical protein